MYGIPRLIETLSACREKPAQAIYASIMASVDNFRAEGPQEDDITLIVIKGT
jgi:serine phosphatase RsbU (regulator of sigma subunit)